MPELKCTVQTCVHNKQYYCDLDHIQVGGEHAKRADETCCDSFEERTGDTYSNDSEKPRARSNIRCEATECRYNQSCKCHAGKISVEGGDACQCKETECATFCC